MLICVFPGSAYWSQDLLRDIAWVLIVDVVGGLGLFHIPRRMVFLQLPNSVLSYNWQVPGLNTCPSLQDLFHKVYFNISFRYLWKTSNLPLLCGWYGAENILSIPSCCKTWSMRLFLNSIPLSDKMYCGHICTAKYSFINVETIVSMVLSGIGDAPGHPVRWSIIVKICLLPDVDVLHSVMRSMAILLNGLSSILSSAKGNVELWLSPHGKVCNLQYIS